MLPYRVGETSETIAFRRNGFMINLCGYFQVCLRVRPAAATTTTPTLPTRTHVSQKFLLLNYLKSF